MARPAPIDDTDAPIRKLPGARERQPYQTPRLTRHGTVAELTQKAHTGTDSFLSLISDVMAKESFESVDTGHLLDRLSELPSCRGAGARGYPTIACGMRGRDENERDTENK